MPDPTTDKITHINIGTITTLTAPFELPSDSMECDDLSVWPGTEANIFAVYRVSNGVRIPGTYTEWIAAKSGNTLGGAILTKGTVPDGGYPADSNTKVVMLATATWANYLVDGILAHANPNGSLKTQAVKDALGITSEPTGGWSLLTNTFTYVSNDGNKQYTIRADNVDLTGTLYPGMKVRLPRTTTPPTQCMHFDAASGQCASKASPSGSFPTATMTFEAWEYLSSYPSTVARYIGGRFDNSAQGAAIRIFPSGQISLFYGTASNYTEFVSNESVELNGWTHIAGVITSVASKTGQIYINGNPVPTTRVASGATAVTYAGALTVGSVNGGIANTYWDGNISEFRWWSTARTQSEIQANMNISLTGSESGLFALHQGNGNWNDKTGTNSLTAVNGASPTQAGNPMSATEYGIITKVSYAAPHTTITVFTGTDYNIPNATLANVSYSTHSNPYGFPRSKKKWQISCISLADLSGTSTSNTWENSSGLKLKVPTGDWDLGFYTNTEINNGGGSAAWVWRAGLGTTSGNNVPALTDGSHGTSVANTFSLSAFQAQDSISLATPTDYYLNTYSEGNTGTVYHRGPRATTKIVARSAWI